jgi:RNA polymerase sigma-70 factor (ECF subfamily)
VALFNKFVWRRSPLDTLVNVVPGPSQPSKPRLVLVKGAPASAGGGMGAGAPEAVLDDAEILAGMRSGDADTAEALYERLRPRILSTVRRLLGAGDMDQDDCVQTAFVEIVKSIGSYRGECSLEHWAAQIAARVVYKQIRKRKQDRSVFDTRAETPDRPEPVDASQRLMARDLFARVRAKLATLDTDKTYTFLLHDVLGFDLREIAQITGVSVAAAQQRLVRGRRAVHVELASDESLSAIARDFEEQP